MRIDHVITINQDGVVITSHGRDTVTVNLAPRVHHIHVPTLDNPNQRLRLAFMRRRIEAATEEAPGVRVYGGVIGLGFGVLLLALLYCLWELWRGSSNMKLFFTVPALLVSVLPSMAQQPPDFAKVISAEREMATRVLYQRTIQQAPVVVARRTMRRVPVDYTPYVYPTRAEPQTVETPLVYSGPNALPADTELVVGTTSEAALEPQRVADLPQQPRPPMAMMPVPVTSPFNARVEFEPITEIRLNARQSAELVNARVCNDNVSLPATMDAERLIMSVGDMRVLTKTQAVWLLSQKRGQDWHVIVPRWGVIGIAAATIASANPMVAIGIPLFQQLMDIITSGQPDIAPFIAEMFPDSFTLQPAGQRGACITGSMFVSKEATSAFSVPGGKRNQKRAVMGRVQ